MASDSTQPLGQLLLNQNGDGGFAPYPNAESTILDTALALLALRQVQASYPGNVAAAVAYLNTRIGAIADPALVQPLGVYTASHVLRALEGYAVQFGLGATTEQLSGALLAGQITPGAWADTPFLTALAYLSVKNFSALESLATNVRAYLAATQSPDGSWGGDPYVTALALQAWVASTVLPANPLRAIIRARLVDAQTLLPLSGVTVTLGGTASAGTNSGVDGSIAFTDLAAGGYSLQINQAGYASLAATTSVKAGQTVDFDEVRMTKLGSATTGTLTGAVKEAASRHPLAGVKVTANTTYSAVTAADGSYQISNVPPGAVSIVASLAGYADATGSATLATGGMLLFSPNLSPQSASAGIQGIVIDGVTGAALAGVSVVASGASNASELTDAQGRYSLTGLSNGPVTLAVSLSGYDPVAASATLMGNELLDFSPKLYPQGTTPDGANTAGVTGIVLDAGSDTPLAGVAIKATYGATTQTLQTDAQGHFVLNGLNADTVDLDFTVMDYQGARITVTLIPLDTVDMGQVRLRKTKVEALLPDLIVKSASRAGASTDPQTLAVSGDITASIANIGSAESLAAAEVLAFSDLNRNGHYDAGVDTMLGQSSVQALAPGAEQSAQIVLHGVLPFRDAPIHIMVDSQEVLAESSETNNVATTSGACQVKPDPGSFAPKLKWAWTGSTVLSSYRQVMSMPVVAPLEDTNGDGKVDGNDIPAVVFIAFSGSNYQSDGVLRALSGKDGHELWTLADSRYRVYPEGTPAVADLDNDGYVEIIVPKSGGGSLVVDHTGAVKWVSAYPSNAIMGAASIADLNGDGIPEISFGNTILNANGSLRWQGSGDAARYFAAGVADLDMDGTPEVIVGASAYSKTGTLLWNNSSIGAGSYIAIGNFDTDPYPEIVVVRSGSIYLLNHDGTVKWGPVFLPGGGGGPPTIADMDGDGVPEIGVAGASRYVAFRADGSILWSATTSDYSSAQTGSSVFDFDGDGNAEVVYADEHTLWVYDGKTGKVLFKTPNTSGTLFELPVIADVDGDGHADIVLCINDYAFSGYGSGIRVYSDANNTWVPTRRIWNQHGYHITNINDDGSVPRVEQNSWQVNNSYRLNAQPGIEPTATADLTASYLRLQDNGGLTPSLLTARIGNGGARAAPVGVSVAFYNGEPGNGGVLLGVVATPRELAGGDYLDLTLELAGPLSGIANLWVAADDDGGGTGHITECDELNNRVHADLSVLAVNLGLAVAVDQAAYGADTDVFLTATVGNAGSFPQAAGVRFAIQSAGDGATVAKLPEAPPATVPSDASRNVAAVWNTGRTYVGAYTVIATLVDALGRPLATAQTGFAISSLEPAAGVGARITSDKPGYLAYDRVSLGERIRNAASNGQLEGLTLATTVIQPNGQALWTNSAPLGQLAPGAGRDYRYSIDLVAAPSGEYRASLTVLDAEGAQLVQIETRFSVAGSGETGSGLAGAISASPANVPLGDQVVFAFELVNHGNAPLTGVPIKISIVDPAAQQVLASYSATTDLPLSTPHLSNFNWSTTGAIGSTYVAILTAEIGGKTRTLAQTNFTLVEPPIRLDLQARIRPGTRLLALVDCPPGEHDHDSEDGRDHDEDRDDHEKKAPIPACALHRGKWLSTTLTSLGIPHHITYTAEDFADTLRCGRYDTYWLSGGGLKLDDGLIAELGEAVRRGGSLLIDGTHDQRNAGLDAIVGVTYKGKLPRDDNPVELLSPLFAAQTLTAQGQTDKYLLAGGSARARFPRAGNVPAIVTRNHGIGQTALVAFDLLGNLQASGWQDPWRTLLVSLAPLLPTAYPGGAWAPLGLTLNNLGQPASVAVTTKLPASVRLDATPADAALDAAGNPSWQLDLGSNQSRELGLDLRLPETTGAYTLDIDVSLLRGGTPVPFAQTGVELNVEAADSVGPQLLAAIQALKPSGKAERNTRDQAANALRQALAELGQGQADHALDDLLASARFLDKITSVAKDQVRFDLAWLIAEAEARLCRAATACTYDVHGEEHNRRDDDDRCRASSSHPRTH
jgi:hypothetical protein